MHSIKIEIKSNFDNHYKIRSVLKQRMAKFLGADFHTDTYFNVRNGILKLRESNIENKLIHESEEVTEKKDILLYNTQKDSSLKKILEKSYGFLKIIEIRREIYSIENIKFYIDFLSLSDNFIKIEAISKNDSHTKEELIDQCKYYINLFELNEWEFVQNSYSDVIEQDSEEETVLIEQTT